MTHRLGLAVAVVPVDDEVCWPHLRLALRDGIGIVTLANPPANALGPAMVDAVEEALAILDEERVRAVIITGEGETFSVGVDVAALLGATAELIGRGRRLLDRIAGASIPVVAAINGHCLGGGLELALACHLRIASSRARLGLPEVRLGLLPALGGTERLPRLVGQARAYEMVLTGRTMRAEEAERIGLVNAVTSEVMHEAERLARRIAGQNRAAVRAAMRCLIAADASADAEPPAIAQFQQLAHEPEVRRTLHALGRSLGERRAPCPI